jgi:predicted RNA methylase
MSNEIDEYLIKYGLEDTWNSLIFNLTNNNKINYNIDINKNLLKDKDFYYISDLYEYSLAFINKINKKKNGQYYTPLDISKFMAKQVKKFDNGIWCDPCCGIGNLSFEILKNNKNMIYTMQFCDLDNLALNICHSLFSYFFQIDYDKIANNFHCCDFLKSNIKYNYIIMNPPYVGKSKGEDLYISFLKKASECDGFIAITPQSFTNSTDKNILSLKEKINSFCFYKIYNFDNIPDCIFNFKKKGIFNTNSSNSVRASITICRNNESFHGISPLMRWKKEDRAYMLSNIDNYIESSNYIFNDNKFLKLFKNTSNFLNLGNKKLKDIISKSKTKYILYIPSTPRYYITASKRKLNRSSYHEIYFKNEDDMNKAYIIINSSYMYWWWRISDGGMTLSKTVLLNVKLPDINIDKNLLTRLESEESTCLVYKLNAGKINENIKHSSELINDMDTFLGVEKLSFTKNNNYI